MKYWTRDKEAGNKIESFGTREEAEKAIEEYEEIDKFEESYAEDFYEVYEEPGYIVHWVGGARDGETLAEFDDEYEAIKFARKFSEEHEEEFDPFCGGVGINNPDGNVVEDW